jgi:hypothetical protein
MPKIQDLTDQLHGATWFSCVDCCAAFHQIPLGDERSKELTDYVKAVRIRTASCSAVLASLLSVITEATERLEVT